MSDQTFKCGNCKGIVKLASVKCSDGSVHPAYVCQDCGASWFPWMLKRDLAWQARDDARRAARRRLAPEAVSHE